MTDIGGPNDRLEFNGERIKPLDGAGDGLQNGQFYLNEGQLNLNNRTITQPPVRWAHNGSLKTTDFEALGSSDSDVIEAVRVQLDGGTVGYIPFAPVAHAAYPEIRIQHNGSVYGLHDSPTVDTGGSTIPDTVASRPTDNDSSAGKTTARGLEITVNGDFSKIGAEISANTSGVDRARLLDDQNNVLDTTDVSGLSSGDAFVFEADLAAGSSYRIALDDPDGSYTIGFSSATDYPYTSTDVDITGRFKGGSVDQFDAHAVNNVGKTGF